MSFFVFFDFGKDIFFMIKEIGHAFCHNPSFGLATKARAYKGAD